jgi:dolichyl-phosphate-mannose--protein O-mannosyl transferase
VAALLWIAYRWILTRDVVMGQILLGVIAGYVPWLLYLNRTVFEFYTIAFEPWLMFALAYGLRHYLNSRMPEDRPATRVRLGYFAAAAFALSLFFLPIWIGTTIPHWFWQIHMWLPSWI